MLTLLQFDADTKIDDMADSKVDDTFLTRMSLYEEKKKMKKDKIEQISMTVSDLQRSVMMIEEEQLEMKRNIAEVLFLLKQNISNQKKESGPEPSPKRDPWSIVI